MIQPDTMTDIPSVSPNRVVGLDTLRALAIVLVLCNHYAVVVSQAPTFGPLTRWGWAGVDLFFVLSGYLIGSQIMAPVARGESFSLPTFMARRLLRTLPNYYVVLALILLMPAELGGRTTAAVWQFLTFTQNFAFTRWGHTFSHSWSLCIEEQFYLVLPVAALLLSRLGRPARAGWCLALAGLVAGMAMRAWWWWHAEPAAAGATLYYSSLTRFDELLPGVMIAMLEYFHPAVFQRLLRHSATLLFSGIALVLLTLRSFGDQIPDSQAVTVLGYPLLALGFGLVLLSCLNPAGWLNRFRLPGAASLAAWSYAVYLAHKPVFKLMLAPLHAAGLSPDRVSGIALVMAAGLGAGWLLFRLVETPFMLLRARWYPSRNVCEVATRLHYQST
jgi:peptidoglycan/LPS O-acetylase OafA/YrhL